MNERTQDRRDQLVANTDRTPREERLLQQIDADEEASKRHDAAVEAWRAEQD